MIAVVVQVPTVNGRPDLQLPASVEVTREGDVFHVTRGDQAITLRFLGRPNGEDPVFVGMLSPAAARALAHLGARVRRLRDTWAMPARKAWLVAQGVVEVDGRPVSPHVIAGASPIEAED